MTETSIPLGVTKSIGPDAVSACNGFREWMRFHCGSVQGAYLHMKHLDKGACEMHVVFDNEDADELRWAHKVRDYTEEAWEHVACGHPAPRHVARSR